MRTLKNTADRFDIRVIPTGRTRDAGHGQETEYSISGRPDDIEDFEQALEDELY